MNRRTAHTVVSVLVAACGVAVVTPPLSADDAAKPATSQLSPADAEAKYAQDISDRATKIVGALTLDDEAKAKRIHDALVAHYRALRDWHDANDPKLKELAKHDAPDAKAEVQEIRATLKPTHDEFLETLAKDLDAMQVEQVKDGLTYNVLHVTYDAYCDMIPQLTDEQKAFIRDQLTAAREVAMDEGSSEAKHAAFGKAKGRINVYLSKQGYDQKKEEAAWRERRKARSAATQPK